MAEPFCATRLRDVIGAAEPRLAAIDDERSNVPRAAGAWTPRQIVGHLIDSAANNHQRFVRGQWQDDLVFPGYDQERWVEVQAYDRAPWRELVALWALYNRHLARVMAATPDLIRRRPHEKHNVDVIGFRHPLAEEPSTLDYLMLDYVAHLEHHLRQILGATWSDGVLSEWTW